MDTFFDEKAWTVEMHKNWHHFTICNFSGYLEGLIIFQNEDLSQRKHCNVR